MFSAGEVPFTSFTDVILVDPCFMDPVLLSFGCCFFFVTSALHECSSVFSVLFFQVENSNFILIFNHHWYTDKQ